MLPKNFTFFGVLSLFLLSTFLSIKSSKKPNDKKAPVGCLLLAHERDRLIKGLTKYGQIPSKKLRQDIVKATEGYYYSRFCVLIGRLLRETEIIFFEETCRKIPTANERIRIIQNILSAEDKLISEFLLQEITALTEGYTILQLSILVSDMMEESETNSLDQEICLKKLQEAVNKIDPDQMKQLKLKQLEETAYKLK